MPIWPSTAALPLTMPPTAARGVDHVAVADFEQAAAAFRRAGNPLQEARTLLAGAVAADRSTALDWLDRSH
ncbi:MAG TPA: hypothetical protein VH333_24295 [Pseudonocardiaceae bacterium]|nr:hypothetical protein [Pseudonocardiaceae bacterium]